MKWDYIIVDAIINWCFVGGESMYVNTNKYWKILYHQNIILWAVQAAILNCLFLDH